MLTVGVQKQFVSKLTYKHKYAQTFGAGWTKPLLN